MSRTLRVSAAIMLAAGLSGCMGLLGGGGKAPPWLLTLTPQAPAPTNIARTAGPGESVTIDTPVIPKEVRTTRVPVHEGPIAIAYVQDLTERYISTSRNVDDIRLLVALSQGFGRFTAPMQDFCQLCNGGGQ